MGRFLTTFVVIVALGWVVSLRGRDRRVESSGLARWLRIAALFPIGLQGVLSPFFGAADIGGSSSFCIFVLLGGLAPHVLLAILGWMRPLEGGIGLMAGAVLSAALLYREYGYPSVLSALTSSYLRILFVPQMISGLLFFIAAMLTRRAAVDHPADSYQDTPTRPDNW